MPAFQTYIILFSPLDIERAQTHKELDSIRFPLLLPCVYTPPVPPRTVASSNWTRSKFPSSGKKQPSRAGWTPTTLANGEPTFVDCMATMRGIQNRERNWLWLHGIVFCRNHLVPDICKSYDFFFSMGGSLTWRVTWKTPQNFLYDGIYFCYTMVALNRQIRHFLPRTWLSTIPDLRASMCIECAGIHIDQGLSGHCLELPSPSTRRLFFTPICSPKY